MGSLRKNLPFFRGKTSNKTNGEDHALESIHVKINERGLTQLRGDTNSKIDIIAIHGFGGHPEGSFTAENEIHWIRDLLGEDIPEARIFVWGYDSTILKLRETAARETFRKISNNLLEELAVNRQITQTTGRRIIFIAHSIGGHILENALMEAYDPFGALDGQHDDIIQSTSGIMLLGTFHKSTDSKDCASIIVDAAMATYKPAKKISKKNIKDLKALAPILPDHVQFFKNLSVQYEFDLVFAHETLETTLKKRTKVMCVPAESATAFVLNRASGLAIQDVDHVGLASFDSRDDINYRAIVDKLQAMIAEAAKKDGVKEDQQRVEGPGRTEEDQEDDEAPENVKEGPEHAEKDKGVIKSPEDAKKDGHERIEKDQDGIEGFANAKEDVPEHTEKDQERIEGPENAQEEQGRMEGSEHTDEGQENVHRIEMVV